MLGIYYKLMVGKGVPIDTVPFFYTR